MPRPALAKIIFAYPPFLLDSISQINYTVKHEDKKEKRDRLLTPLSGGPAPSEGTASREGNFDRAGPGCRQGKRRTECPGGDSVGEIPEG